MFRFLAICSKGSSLIDNSPTKIVYAFLLPGSADITLRDLGDLKFTALVVRARNVVRNKSTVQLIPYHQLSANTYIHYLWLKN